MDCVLRDWKQATPRRPSIPIICPLSATVVNNQDVFWAVMFCRPSPQPCQLLRGAKARQRYWSGQVTLATTFIDIGPNSVFCRMVEACLGNANESEVFVNHGWDALRLYEKILPNKPYHSWVQMTRGEGTVWYGSLTILTNIEVAGEIDTTTVSRQPGNTRENICTNKNVTNQTPSASMHTQGALGTRSLGSQSRTVSSKPT